MPNSLDDTSAPASNTAYDSSSSFITTNFIISIYNIHLEITIENTLKTTPLMSKMKKIND
jgi:hypothetical protein